MHYRVRVRVRVRVTLVHYEQGAAQEDLPRRAVALLRRPLVAAHLGEGALLGRIRVRV